MEKSLNLIRKGAGPKRLVFIHGLCGKKELWDSQLLFFSPSYETLSVDLLGHGDSPPVEAKSLIAKSVDALRALLRKLPSKPTVLIGHSLGGWVVHEILNRGDSSLSGVFVDSPCLYAAEKNKDYYEWGVQILAAEDPQAFVREWFAGFVSDHCQLREGVIDEAQKFQTTWLAEIMQTTQVPPRPTHGSPVFVMEGAQFFGPENQLSWSEYYPEAPRWHHPEPGHYLFLEAPEKFNRALQSWLSD